MLLRKESPRSVRIVGGLLAAVWIGAGLAALVIAVMKSRWLLAVLGLAALWLGALWVRVVREGRRLTFREALTPWRTGQRSDA